MRLTSLYLEAINYTSHKPQLDSLSKQLNKTPQEIITLIEPITDAARYVEWILRQLKTNTVRLPEDAGRVKQLLIDFDHYKSIGAADINRDIGSYKTIHDLEAVIDKLKGVDLKGRAETRQEYRAGTQWVNESQNYKLLKITTPEAAAHYGLNTKWCTSNPKTAKKYLKKGPLYIIFKKQQEGKLKKLYQYTHDYSQFMDILDKPIRPDKEIQQLIKPPLDSKLEILVGFCVFIGSRWPEAEPIIAKNSRWAYFYVRDVLKRPWPEAEPTISKDPAFAYHYARGALKRPWSEAEPYIAKDSIWAWYYARYVLEDRFLEAEPYIAKSPQWAYYYALDILKHPWPEAEPYIIQDPCWAYFYAQNILKRRWPEAEPVIVQNPEWACYYAKNVLRRPWPEAEPTMIQDAKWIHYYAKNVLEHPWPEAEPHIARIPHLAYQYAVDVLKGRFPAAEPAIANDSEFAYCYAIHVLKRPWPEAEPTIVKNPEHWTIYAQHFNIES